MIAKRVMILICICLCVMLLISCADGALHAPWTTSSYLPGSSSTHETTSGSGENSDKPENNLAAPEVVFVSGNTEYRCGYYEKSTETKVENGTSAVLCGRAILGGFDRRELIGRIPEVSVNEPFYIMVDSERCDGALLNLYSVADGKKTDGGEGVSAISDIVRSGDYIGELFVTRTACDGSSVAYAFYVLLKS